MSFEDSIKRGQEIKKQPNQAKSISNSTKQTINLGKGVSTNYEHSKSGRPTYEGVEPNITTGEVLND